MKAIERIFRARSFRILWFVSATLIMLATSYDSTPPEPRIVTERISCPSVSLATSQSIVASQSECPPLVLLGLTHTPAEDAPKGEAKAIIMLPYLDRAIWESADGSRQELIRSTIFGTNPESEWHMELHTVQLPEESLSAVGETPLHIKAVRSSKAYNFKLKLNIPGTDLVQPSNFIYSLNNQVIVTFFRPTPMSDTDAKSQINIPDDYTSLVRVEGEGRLVIVEITGLTPAEVRADFANGLPRLSIQAATP